MNPDNFDILKYSLKPVPFITEVLNLDCRDFHDEWIELFENNNFISLQAPRGHGKTTIIGAYIMWRIVRDPDIRILIVTINQDKADEMMTFIQHHLEGNEKIIEVFGEQRGYSREWSRSTLRVMRAGKSGFAHKEPTLTVLGITSSMVGGHYDLIVLDDITDQKNSRTEYRRQELVRWYNLTLMPMLEPEGKILSIGTRWHENDIHHYLETSSGFTHKRYQAIIDDEKKKVLWPERFSYNKLQEIKQSVGSVGFELQYQNNIISSGESPIKMEWIQISTENFKMITPPFETYIGVDLASKGDESDYFVITVVGVKDGCVFVLDGLRTKASLFRQFELIKSYDAKWQPSKIGIESAAQQKIITDQWMDMGTLPIVPIKSSSSNDKNIRVQRLSVLFETGRVLLNPVLTSWIDELIMYPRGMYDDTIDSLAFAIQSSQIEEDSEVDWESVKNMIASTRNHVIKQSSDVKEKRNYRISKI
jgi:predicted phage terminase large subunit-like protein